MKNREFHTEEINVDFYEAMAGWISFKVKIGEQIFDGRFSEVFDPILDFKKWLEAIAIGVQQTSFDFDPEGNDIKFDFERVCWNREVLTICEPYKEGEIFIKANVNRKQVVKEFYMSLINFSKSNKYNPKEWETEYFKERLCKIFKISEEKLITNMLELDKDELKDLLFKTDPIYMVSFPDAKDKSEEIDIFVKSVFEGEKSIEEFKKVETPIEWTVPQDYDYWTSEKRKEYIIDCLNESTSGFNGMKLVDFQSNLIERYLYYEEESTNR